MAPPRTPRNDAGFDPTVPVKDPDKMISWAEAKRENSHTLPERESYLNLAFMLGHQHVIWDSYMRRLDQPRSRRGDPNAPVRITANKIGTLVERVIARLTKTAPRPEVRPVSQEESDVATAKVGTRILEHEMTRLKWETMLPRLYFWVVPLGWSFFHIRWDPDAGSVVGEDEDGESVHMGEITMDIVPAIEMRVDPGARTWDEAQYCVRTMTMTREKMYDLWGVTAVDADTANIRNIADDIYRLADGTTYDTERRTARVKADRVAVHQLWLKPGHRMYPQGLVITWTGGTVLEMIEEYPYEHGELPFVPFSLMPGLGYPEGRTWMSDLRGLQTDYNDARSREATIRRTLVPKLLAARGQIDPARMTSRVEVVDYVPTGPEPKWMMPDGRWMAQFEQGMNRADAEMGDRAGQAEVSQGRAPAGAPAAAILALQEADETKLAISAKELAESIERMGHMILMLVRQFWTEERLVRAWSQDGRLDTMHFRGADLPGQLDVHVTSESMLPKSKSARAQLALDLWDRQILRDPALFMRMLEVPGVSFLQEEFDRDARQAEREWDHLMLGDEEVVAEDWHNHQAHLAKHYSDMKTEEYEQLLRRDPSIRERVEWHLTEHKTWLAYQQSGQLPPGIEGGQVGVPGMEGGAAEGGGFGQEGHYIDPATGLPPDPLAVASGQSPSALSFNPPNSLDMGGPVPGQTPDSQARLTGN